MSKVTLAMKPNRTYMLILARIDILSNISGNVESPSNDRICVMVGDQDVLMDLSMCRKQVAEYRQGLAETKSLEQSKAHRDTASTEAIEGVTVESGGGVRMAIVEGAG